MDTKAIADAIKPVVESAVETRTAPLVKRIEDLEAKGRERPSLEVSADGKDWSKAEEPKTGTKGFSVPGIDRRKFSLGRLVKAMALAKKLASDPWKGAGYEQEVFQHVAKVRASTLGNDAQAGFLIPNEVMPEVIENLRAKSIMNMIGVQQMTGLSASPVQIRRRTASTTGYWVGESAAITESVPTYDRLNLTPKKCAVLSDVSGELWRKDPSLIQSEIGRDIETTLRLKEEVGFFEGSGAAGQPLGLDNVTGINTGTAISTHDATEVGYLQDMIEEVAVDNVNLDGACWVMHARAWFQIQRLQSSTVANTVGLPVLSFGSASPQGTIQTAMQPMLLGFPVHICNSLTASNTTVIKFIVPSQIIWADWGNPEVAVSTEAGNSFANDEVLVRILHEVDVAVRHPEAICKTTYTY